VSVATIALVALQIGAPNVFEYWEIDRGIVIRALGLFFSITKPLKFTGKTASLR
jgi:hypothetical protein